MWTSHKQLYAADKLNKGLILVILHFTAEHFGVKYYSRIKG